MEMSHVFVSFTLYQCLSLPITTEDSAAEASSGEVVSATHDVLYREWRAALEL